MAIAGAAAVALTVSGVAFATWISSGDGTGPVSSASVQQLTVQVDPVSGLYPGASLRPGVGISNPNHYPLNFSAFTATSDNPACYTAVADPLPPIAPIPASSGSTPGYLLAHITVSMPVDAPPACAGQTFTVSVHAEGSIGSNGPSTGILPGGSLLHTGQSVTSANGVYALYMQGDGNLVEYGAGGTVVWASNTVGNPGAFLGMQGDGNFVLNGTTGVLLASNTQGNPGAYLHLFDSGQLSVVGPGGNVLWTA